MNERAAWGLLTGGLMIAWTVGVTLVVVAVSPWSLGATTATAMVIGGLGAGLILAVRMRRLPSNPAPRRQPRWLVPGFIVLMVVGLVVVVLGIAAQFWLIIVAGSLGVLGNGLGLWSQLLARRRSRAGHEHD